MLFKNHRHREDLLLFFFILSLTFVLWWLYRLVLPAFPTWFDETVGKALFFGLPVWLFLTATQDKQVWKSFAWEKFEPGILTGVAFGGIYGFVTSILLLLSAGTSVQPAQLFLSPQFWTEFMLAMFTGFWETLLFFSVTQTMLQKYFPKLSLNYLVIIVSAIFVAFHLPNMILRADVLAVAWQVLLLALFAGGQSLIFAQTKNSYTLILSQAFWGMVLLTHSL